MIKGRKNVSEKELIIKFLNKFLGEEISYESFDSIISQEEFFNYSTDFSLWGLLHIVCYWSSYCESSVFLKLTLAHDLSSNVWWPMFSKPQSYQASLSPKYLRPASISTHTQLYCNYSISRVITLSWIESGRYYLFIESALGWSSKKFKKNLMASSSLLQRKRPKILFILKILNLKKEQTNQM